MCTADNDWTDEAKRAEGDPINDGGIFLRFFKEYIPTPTGFTADFEESKTQSIPKTAEEYNIWAAKYKAMPIISKYIPKVMELGINIGKWLPTFDARHFEIHGLDQCEYAIEVATKRYPHLKYNIYLSRIWDLDGDEQFKQKFDLVYTVAVIQHNTHEQTRQILKTIKWLLKPGGYYFMTENTRPEPNYDDGYSFDYDGWSKFFKESGFEIVKYTSPPDNMYMYLWKMIKND
jgi:SAM-dependent methyltransferase